MEQRSRILLLDGETRAALAVVRSLGKLDTDITVASTEPGAISFTSKYCSQKLICPKLMADNREFSIWLKNTLDEINPRMLIALTDASLDACLKLEKDIRDKTELPFVDYDTFAAISDKGQLMETASSLGITTPRTLKIPLEEDRESNIFSKIESFTYPAVLKPCVSACTKEGEYTKTAAAYVKNAQAVRRLLESKEFSGLNSPLLLQEQIHGSGLGVFAMFVDGEAAMTFAHKRLLEKPPSGGISVLSESIPLSSAPLDNALNLLKHYRWRGAAMVEFKVSEDGKCYLMEVNPRFWGSLQLAIDAGRDFPAALFGKQNDADNYKEGARLRWLLGTLDHFLINLKSKPLHTLARLFFCNSLQLFSSWNSTRLEVLRMEDPKPFFMELKHYIGQLLFRTTPKS